MVAGYTVMGALGQSATPRLARYYQSNRSAFKRLLAKMMLVAAAVGAAGILVVVLWGRPLLTLLYRPDYAQHANVFVWVMVAAAISYVLSVFGYALTSQRVLRSQVPLVGAMVVVSTLACYFCVPAFGLLGAAVALVASNLVGTFIGAFLVIRAESAPVGRSL
jgi:O-antigen/teichoic acid export membrane protein